MARDVRLAPPFLLRWLPAVAQAGLIFGLSAQHVLPRPPGLSPSAVAILGHFTVYAILTGAIWWALPAHALSARQQRGVALIGALAYAATDEWHQSFVSGRDPSLFDFFVDATGAVCAFAVLRARWWARTAQAGGPI